MRNGSIKEETDRILEQIEVDISEIDLYVMILLKLLFRWCISYKAYLMI